MKTYKERSTKLRKKIAKTEGKLSLLNAKLKDLEESQQHLAISHLDSYLEMTKPRLTSIRSFLRVVRGERMAG